MPTGIQTVCTKYWYGNLYLISHKPERSSGNSHTYQNIDLKYKITK